MNFFSVLLNPDTRRLLCQAISLTGALLAFLAKAETHRTGGRKWL